MAEANKGCPVCGCKDKTSVEAKGGEWVSLIISGIGAVNLSVCLNCGCVYIQGHALNQARDYLRQAKEKRKQWLNT